MSLKNNQFYKGRYFIAFYGADDEEHIGTFDNIKEICVYKGREINAVNLNLISVELYRALQREDHTTRMLDGSPMHVYLMDIYDEDEIEGEEI